MKTIVITGGAGFVGSNIAIKLKSNFSEINVICFDNLKRRGSELILKRLSENKIEFIHGDVRNKEDFLALPKYDVMIECSAEPSVLAGINSSPEYLINTNLIGTINCLESVRNNKANIIFLSTSRVYPIELINDLKFDIEDKFCLSKHNSQVGVSEKGISEDFPLGKTRSLYGSTKLCSEFMIAEYSEAFKINAIINRCGLITGPWQMGKIDQGVVMFWLAKHYFKKDLSYIGFGGEGNQVRDFMHIDDLSDLIILQIKKLDEISFDTFNVGGGIKNSFSLKELTHACEITTKNKINITKIPETRYADLKWYVSDYSKVSKTFNWVPKRDLLVTLEDMFVWMKEHESLIKTIF